MILCLVTFSLDGTFINISKDSVEAVTGWTVERYIQKAHGQQIPSGSPEASDTEDQERRFDNCKYLYVMFASS